jgi:hypothetical protein
VIAGPQKDQILKAATTINPDPSLHREDVFGVGETARKILETLISGN